MLNVLAMIAMTHASLHQINRFPPSLYNQLKATVFEDKDMEGKISLGA